MAQSPFAVDRNSFPTARVLSVWPTFFHDLSKAVTILIDSIYGGLTPFEGILLYDFDRNPHFAGVDTNYLAHNTLGACLGNWKQTAKCMWI